MPSNNYHRSPVVTPVRWKPVKLKVKVSTHKTTHETCTRSGGISDIGIRGERGMVWKWMDGKILKEDSVEIDGHSVRPNSFCLTSSEGTDSTFSNVGGRFTRIVPRIEDICWWRRLGCRRHTPPSRARSLRATCTRRPLLSHARRPGLLSVASLVESVSAYVPSSNLCRHPHFFLP